MRAKIASRAGGHAFEERFLKLDPAQLTILYFQAMDEEQKEITNKMSVIQKVSDVWAKKFDSLFELQQFFANPKMYKAKLDLMETKKLGEEISEDNFLEVWDDLMQYIPDTYVVEEPTANVENLLAQSDTEEDREWADMVAGWVSTSRKFEEE